MTMASHLTPAAGLFFLLILSASTTAEPWPRRTDIDIAVDEMQGAGYFSFAMLVSMVQDSIEDNNITFLMPTDQALSEAPPKKDAVLQFLRRHSIPSPLPFEELSHLPTGTAIPTSQPGCMVKVSSISGSRGGLCLNGIELVHPTICVSGTSIRCHGMNAVFEMSAARGNKSSTPRCPWGGSIAPGPSPLHSGSPANYGQGGRSGNTVLTYIELLAAIASLVLLLLS